MLNARLSMKVKYKYKSISLKKKNKQRFPYLTDGQRYSRIINDRLTRKGHRAAQF